jgi:hypothetical protein
MLTHESNKSRKLLLKIGKTGLSSLTNRTIQFCQFRWQSRVPATLDEGASPLAKQHLNER